MVSLELDEKLSHLYLNGIKVKKYGDVKGVAGLRFYANKCEKQILKREKQGRLRSKIGKDLTKFSTQNRVGDFLKALEIIYNIRMSDLMYRGLQIETKHMQDDQGFQNIVKYGTDWTSNVESFNPDYPDVQEARRGVYR